jgi:hypothetical protein
MKKSHCVWQYGRQNDEEKKEIEYMNWSIKKQRKKLSKQLRSIQAPGRYIHVMDDDMFNTVIQMLESKTDTDIQMARDIILNSKMKEHHMNLFISRHYSVILNDYTWSQVW